MQRCVLPSRLPLKSNSKYYIYRYYFCIIPNCLYSLEEVVDNFDATHFRWIRDSNLTVEADTSPASVKVLHGRGIPSKLEIFETVFGAWLLDELFPALNTKMAVEQADHKPKQRRRWKQVSFVLLIRYFLFHFLGATKSHGHEKDDTSAVAELRKKLNSISTFKVISSSLDLHEDIIRGICQRVPHCLQRYVNLGGAVVIDEALWSYYGKKAKKAGYLRFMPNKPHKEGVLSYIFSQRLRFTNRPLFLAIAPTFLRSPPTPREALMHLNPSLLACGFERPDDWILITDSLWSYPSHIMEFMDLGWRFVISVKDITTSFPAVIRHQAALSLHLNHARTYTDNFLTVQLVHGVQGVTAVVSNAVEVQDIDPHGELPICDYSTAVHLFTRDKPAAIVRLCRNLSEEDLILPKEQLIFKATGWDVLRPANEQGSTIPLSRTTLKKFNRAQLARIYEITFRTKKSGSPSMERMIDDLCPEEETDTVTPDAADSRKRKLDQGALETRVKELIGPETTTHKLYDIFSDNYACIDRLDKEYYAYGKKAWVRHLHTDALYCMAWYVMDSCHAIWEEYVRESVYAQSSGNNAATAAVASLSSTDYLIELTNKFLSKYPCKEKKHH